MRHPKLQTGDRNANPMIEPHKTTRRSIVTPRIRMGLRGTVCGLAVALLAGCSTMDVANDVGSAGGRGLSTTAASLNEPVDPGAAMAIVPAEAGAVVSVVERRQHVTAGQPTISQRIVLAGDARTTGENAIDITFTATAAGTPPARLTDADLAEEAARQFPDLTVQMSNRLIVNTLGPLAIAEGQSHGVACVFAWQRVDAAQAQVLSIEPTDRIDLKIRLCRSDRSLDQIVEAIHRIVPLRRDQARATVDVSMRAPTGDALVAAGGLDRTQQTAISATQVARAKPRQTQPQPVNASAPSSDKIRSASLVPLP